MFGHIEPALRIFGQWKDRFGEVDKYEELRISIIEGRIPRKATGYTIHLGADPEGMRRRADADARPPERLLPGRFHRSENSPNSPHLPRFKSAFRRLQQFFFLPFSSSNGKASGALTPRLDLAIQKTVLHFKSSLLLRPTDQEYVVLG